MIKSRWSVCTNGLSEHFLPGLSFGAVGKEEGAEQLHRSSLLFKRLSPSKDTGAAPVWALCPGRVAVLVTAVTLRFSAHPEALRGEELNGGGFFSSGESVCSCCSLESGKALPVAFLTDCRKKVPPLQRSYNFQRRVAR